MKTELSNDILVDDFDQCFKKAGANDSCDIFPSYSRYLFFQCAVGWKPTENLKGFSIKNTIFVKLQSLISVIKMWKMDFHQEVVNVPYLKVMFICLARSVDVLDPNINNF